jgi:thiamine kinase-like enzyme
MDRQRNVYKLETVYSKHEEALPAGHPIFIYENFFLDEWKLAGEDIIKNEGHSSVDLQIYVAQKHHEALLALVKGACESFEQAGVCHLDLRLSNIIYKFDENGALKIKVIDWDYSHLLNAPLDPAFAIMIEDLHFFPSHLNCASKEWHDFSLQIIEKKINAEKLIAEAAKAKKKEREEEDKESKEES